MKKGYVDTRSGQLHYVTMGQGQPLLMLHNSARSWRTFSRLIPILAPHYQCIAVDLPGFGESDLLKPGFEVSDITGQMIDLFDHLKLDKVCLYGHHQGALIVGDIAVEAPHRTKAVVMSGYPFLESEAERRMYEALATTTMGTKLEKGAPRTLPLAALEQDGTHLVRLWQRASWRLWQGKNLIPYEGLTEEEIEFISDWVSDTIKARKAVAGTFQALWRYDSVAKLKLLKSPSLLIQLSGTIERDICQRAHLVQPLIKGAKLTIIENGDIYMNYWRAEEVASILRKFFGDPAGFKSQTLTSAR